jgi:hypothetical protein
MRQIGAIGKPLPDQAFLPQCLQHAQQGGLGQTQRHVHFVQAGRAARLHLQQDIQSTLQRADSLHFPVLHPVPRPLRRLVMVSSCETEEWRSRWQSQIPWRNIRTEGENRP